MNSTNNSTPPVFEGNAAFLRELFKISSCERRASFLPPSGPIDCSAALETLHKFCETYEADRGFSYFPTKIKLDSFLGGLLNKLKTTSFGLVFHYGYDTAKKEIVYILSKGKLDSNDKVSYCAFSNEEIPDIQGARYLLLKSNSLESYDIINEEDLQEFKTNYQNKMRRQNGTGFANIDANHPKLVYHEPTQLLHFYNRYKDQYDPHLYIAHGAIQSADTNEAYHTPCFFFGDRTSFFKLDNTGDPRENTVHWYTNKGLNIGKLCPPHCKTPVTPC